MFSHLLPEVLIVAQACWLKPSSIQDLCKIWSPPLSLSPPRSCNCLLICWETATDAAWGLKMLSRAAGLAVRRGRPRCDVPVDVSLIVVPKRRGKTQGVGRTRSEWDQGLDSLVATETRKWIEFDWKYEIDHRALNHACDCLDSRGDVSSEWNIN